MILVVVLQDLLGERRQLDAIARQIVADLLLVDRMGLVEVNDRVDARLQVEAALLRLGVSQLLSCTVPSRTFDGLRRS
jgi:hypothetical protein